MRTLLAIACSTVLFACDAGHVPADDDSDVDLDAGSDKPFGESCGDGEECASGTCADTPAGKVCTADCSDGADCPAGSQCMMAGSDPEFPGQYCVPSSCDPAVDPTCPIDPSCAADGDETLYPPFVPLDPPSVPASCAGGFELNNCHPTVYTIASAGSQAITLDVDLATYVAPNRVTIRGIDAAGQSYVLLDTCRLQTWDKADPTGGDSRPPDETIRQFQLAVKAGTTELSFDFSDPDCKSPFYLRVVGLCDFDLPEVPSCKWRAAGG